MQSKLKFCSHQALITLKPRLNLINSPSLTRSYIRFLRTIPRHSLLHPQSPNSHSFLSKSHSHRRLTAVSPPQLPPACKMSVIDPETQPESDGSNGNPNAIDEGSDRSVVSVDDEYREVDEASARDSENFERRALPELPEEMCKSVVKLTCESSVEGGECVVYLIGTAHVSLESCQEVEAVIKFLQPQVVFLELCASRVSILAPQNLKVPTIGDMIDQWKKKKNNAFGILYSWFLAKVASKLEVFPGSEFRVAYEEAMKYGGKVILGDRAVNITLGRTWGKMPLWHKLKLLYSLLFQAILLPSAEDLNRMLKEMDDVDMLTLVIQELSKEFPTVMETLVHERDKYMSSRLLKVANEHSSVVAVVGKGHLQGIKKHWKQPVELNELLAMPSRKGAISAAKILQTIGVTVAGVAIVSGLYLSSKK